MIFYSNYNIIQTGGIFVEKNAIIKRYICPYCGKWHECAKSKKIGDYTSNYMAEFKCNEDASCTARGKYSVYFSDGYIYYRIERIFTYNRQVMEGKTLISNIKESDEFQAEVTTIEEKSLSFCWKCELAKHCYICLLDKANRYQMKLTLGFEFEQSN